MRVMDDPEPYAAAVPIFSTPVTLEEVRLAYYKYSGPAIVKALHTANAANWNLIMDSVAAGDADWIFYSAIYIAPGTDAGPSTEYTITLALALSNNPKAVLELESSGPGRSLLSVCDLPFIEPEYAFIKSYGEKTLAALRGLDQPYLADSRDICLDRLEKSLASAAKAHAEGRWQ